jgi:hypothetical protein
MALTSSLMGGEAFGDEELCICPRAVLIDALSHWKARWRLMKAASYGQD